MPNKEIDANVLGKLLFLQSTLEVMPDKQGVIGLVCEGLLLVPGVESVSYLESPDKNASSDELALCIPISSRHTKYGVIEFGIDDAEAFARYKPHIQNVANTIALAFDNRHYISEINQYRDQLEHRVQERTAELANLHIKFEAMTETVSDVLYMIDTDARVIWWNKHVEQITGLSPDELLNRPAADFIHKDDWPRLQQAIERAFATGEAEEDLLCHTINGPVPYHFKGSVVRNNDGTVIGLTGISRDISERNKAEAELLHSEKRLQSIIEGNPVPTIITRMSDGLVKYANQPIAKLFRISEKEVIGKQTPDYFVHPEERALMMRELAGAGKTQSHEVHLQRPDGTLFWAVVTLSAIDFDGEASVMTSVYDTTERKLAEEKLRAIAQLNVQSTGEDFFRVLVESVARLLSVKVAFAAEFSSIGTASARSLAIWSSEELIENMHWTLSGTPCEQVAKGKSVFIAKGVQAAFPDDQWLAEAGLESYLGVPMLDNRGYAIGHIGIMDDKPVPKREPAEDLLSAFAGRATAELERMRTQEALASSEANFRNLVEADCYALIVHRDFHLLYANTEAKKIFKVPDKDSLPGKSIFDYVHPRYRNFARLSIQRLIRRNESITPIQIKGVTADGQEIDVDLRSMPIQFDGSPAVMTIIYEITARKRGEYFTGRTSEILEMMATSSPAYEVYDAICRMYENIYPRMRISILKLKGNRLFHCSAPSLPDEYSRAIDGGEIGPCAGSCGTAAFLGKEVIVEDIASDPLWVDYKNIALPHKLRACWSEPVVASDGRILGTLAMYFDQPVQPNRDELKEIRNASGLVAIVMERENREEMLNKLSQALEQAGESILITDREGIIEYANPAFTTLTGYSAEEAIGQTPRILKSGNQDAAFYEQMWETISGGKVWNGKVIDRKKDGSLYSAKLTISPISGKSGETTHFVSIQSDLTKLEDMEHQFHQAQKMEAIGTLVGGIAHDFNNMLAGITGNLYLAKQKADKLPDLMQNLDNIKQLSFRAADMIQQLLTFARKGIVSIQQMPLNPFIKETLKMLRKSVPENISMHWDICSNVLQINGDTTQLHQVLLNLINNARDAVEGVKNPCISIRMESFNPDDAFLDSHAYFQNQPYAHLSVEDNGCGIAENKIEHIFEPFFTTKAVGKGTGLGLAMVFGAVKTHHGFMEVKSSEGEGSTFHVYLPLLHTDKRELKLAQKQEEARGHGELILLVDDEPQIIDIGREVLEALGYQVLTAMDGAQAVEIFEARCDEINLIITDVIMPVMSGVKAARKIRQIKPEAKIIFSTGYDKNLQADLADEVILSKPFSIEKMSQLLRRQLRS